MFWNEVRHRKVQDVSGQPWIAKEEKSVGSHQFSNCEVLKALQWFSITILNKLWDFCVQKI